MILSDIEGRLQKRLGEIPGAPVGLQHYPIEECTTAINQVQRLFALFTLCLETTGAPVEMAGAAFISMLSQFPDWIAPLRVRNSEGAKLLPRKAVELAALDASWTLTVGVPSSYCILGFDAMGFYPHDAVSTLSVTYAQSPPVLVNATDVPAIPERYHQFLIDGAIPVMRVKEGDSEFQKTMGYWQRFMDAVNECAGKVRARNVEQGYDSLPVELRRWDQSKLIKMAGQPAG